MKLISMKLKPKTKKQLRENMAVPMEDSGEKYPWGLSLNLESEALEKLGMSAEDVSVGDHVMIVADGEITSTSQNESTRGKKRESVGVQLTALHIGDKADKD